MSADNEGKRLIEKDKDKDKMEDVPSPSVEEVDEQEKTTGVEEEEEVDEYDPDKSGKGPIKNRSCTDILCLGRGKNVYVQINNPYFRSTYWICCDMGR